MELLGKMTDVFIMIIVLFIFPVMWGLSLSKDIGETGLAKAAGEFMESIDEDGYIGDKHMALLNGYLTGEGGYSAEISVIRKGEGRLIQIEPNAEPELYPYDTVFLKISDNMGAVCSAVRCIQ